MKNLAARRTDRWVVSIAAVGATTALVSAALPLSYDEAFWLAISRMVREGSVLYETAIDNKSPLVYGFFWLLDVMPGPFVVSRALALGSVAAFLFYMILGLPSKAGRRHGVWIPLLITFLVMLQAAFRLQTELIAAPFAAGAIHAACAGRARRGALLSIVATSITPIAVGLIPVSLYLARRPSSEIEWRQAVVMTMAAVSAIVITIASIDNLRFGLVELNLASRSGLSQLSESPTYAFALSAMSLLALVVLGRGRRWDREIAGVLAVVALPAVLAGFGFPHYWILVSVTAGVLDKRNRDRPETHQLVSATALSLIPIVMWTFLQVGPTQRVTDRYQKVADTLATVVGLDWEYVQADLQPYLAVHFPDRVGLYSPSINYLAWETSRSEQHLSQLAVAAQTADVLIDPGLQNPTLQPIDALAPALSIITGQLNRFTCSVRIDSLTIRATEPLCAALEGHALSE